MRFCAFKLRSRQTAYANIIYANEQLSYSLPEELTLCSVIAAVFVRNMSRIPERNITNIWQNVACDKRERFWKQGWVPHTNLPIDNKIIGFQQVALLLNTENVHIQSWQCHTCAFCDMPLSWRPITRTYSAKTCLYSASDWLWPWHFFRTLAIYPTTLP